MQTTIIIRHRKENLKKCSLRGLETREDMRFFTYPIKTLPNLSHYTLLSMDAPLLSSTDSHRGLLLLDATWRYASQMEKNLEPLLSKLPRRSLPAHFRSAYPRRQPDCPNPDCGLASIEALFLAYHILGWDTKGLLDPYYWKAPFLEKNQLDENNKTP